MSDFKTLLVMRHAKSSWKQPGLTDHDRSLNKRGQRDAKQMAEFLAGQNVTIDHIACSTAVRAQMTARIIVESTKEMSGDQLELREDFYLAPPRVYLSYLSGLTDDSISTLMVVGHNPGLESLVEFLGESWETMPTGAIACFEIDSARWQDCLTSAWRLDHMWRPKDVLAEYQ